LVANDLLISSNLLMTLKQAKQFLHAVIIMDERIIAFGCFVFITVLIFLIVIEFYFIPM